DRPTAGVRRRGPSPPLAPPVPPFTPARWLPVYFPPQRGAHMPLQFDDTISLRTAGSAHFTSLRQIVLIAARDNYSDVTLSGGTRVVLRKSLKSWQSVLPPTHFLRVHRMLIVNLTSIVRYERDREEHTRLFL